MTTPVPWPNWSRASSAPPGSTRGSGRCPAPVAALAGRAVGRLWPGDEPPLTYFAARQLSVAHWFDQSDTQRVLRWAPAVGVDHGMEELGRWFAAR